MSNAGWVAGTAADGMDSFGFSALPQGYWSGTAQVGLDSVARWWSATEGNVGTAWYAAITNDDDAVLQGQGAKASLRLPVRCIKD